MTNNKKYYPWIVVALLWGVALLNYMDRQMLSTMKSAMMIDITELESATNFGRLMAVFLWIYGLMSPVAGMIADRINRKWLIVGSLFVWSFVTLMMGYSTDFNQIYILRAIMGVSEALYIPAGLSLITDYHQEKTRSLAVGIHMTGLYDSFPEREKRSYGRQTGFGTRTERESGESGDKGNGNVVRQHFILDYPTLLRHFELAGLGD